jgi:hypothetical protein
VRGVFDRNVRRLYRTRPVLCWYTWEASVKQIGPLTVAVLAVVTISVHAHVARAQREETAPDAPRHFLLIGAAWGIFVETYALTVSYEHMVTDSGGLRVGGGYTRLACCDGEGEGVGGFAMYDLLFGSGRSKLELGLGVSATYLLDEYDWCPGAKVGAVCLSPAFSLSYRRQPTDGTGAVFRAGLIWTLAYGLPIGVGVGAAF